MFHGLTMVNFDGQTQNQMMVRSDHGQPWSDGQTVAGASIKFLTIKLFHILNLFKIRKINLIF